MDVGGTFTDVVLEHGLEYYTTKLLTTHDQPAKAVLQGVKELLDQQSISPAQVSLVLHGTTLATNAIIERKGAVTALLTTEGHRDVIEMAHENRFEQYDISIERPVPLIPRYLRLPIRERIDSSGQAIRTLDKSSIDTAIEALKSHRVTSVAIGFINAYANAEHEERTAEYLSKKLPDMSISLSSEVCPEIREYERFSTTCANAYVLPLMSSYMNDLAAALKAMGCDCPFMVMTSNGGLTTLENASKFPIRLVESGPAGGVILASQKTQQLGVEQAISFDMGGTTAKICLIDGSKPLRSRTFEVDRRYRFKKGSGLPVRIPVVEMVEIGAGGGSIASVDALRRVQVGPASAGSTPGPACYGRGGARATVTDADATLGRLEPSKFAGGKLRLDTEAAIKAIDQSVANTLGLSTGDASFAISEVVDENMASAARSHASEWGLGLSGRVLIAFGGAAPLHAARLMEKLNCSSVLIPVNAGVGSALGFLNSPIAYEVVRSRYMKLSEFNEQSAGEAIAEMQEEAKQVVTKATTTTEPLDISATALMRYVGQGYEISVEVDLVDCTSSALKTSFDAAYHALYGRLLPNSDIEIMSWTLTASTITKPVHPLATVGKLESYEGEFSEQTMYSSESEELVRCYDRRNLQSGHVLSGPALITETDTTTVVPQGFELFVNGSKDLILKKADT